MTARLSIFYVTGACGRNLNRRRLGNTLQLHAAQGKVTDELAAAAERALDLELCTVAMQNVFDDSEA
jgi:hypothetical protein